jgi:hypothetical protein
MELKKVEYECFCGNKVVLENVTEGWVFSTSPCGSCGRYGAFMLKDGALLYQGPDFLMVEWEGRGLEKFERRDNDFWVKLKNWSFVD